MLLNSDHTQEFDALCAISECLEFLVMRHVNRVSTLAAQLKLRNQSHWILPLILGKAILKR